MMMVSAGDADATEGAAVGDPLLRVPWGYSRSRRYAPRPCVAA